MEQFGQFFEHFKVHANELGDKVRDLIHEGNVRRIIIKGSGHMVNLEASPDFNAALLKFWQG